jgi:hypothetical protein
MYQEKRLSLDKLMDQMIERLERMVDEKGLETAAPGKAGKRAEATGTTTQQ